MNLTVVTHTAGDRPDLLERAKASVPAWAKHEVIEVHGSHRDWAQARLEALKLNEYVAFLDDDDVLNGQALKSCLDALEGQALAFTDEEQITMRGEVLAVSNRSKVWYEHLVLSPRTIHHLAVIRGEVVKGLEPVLDRTAGIGVDWLIRVAAAEHGAKYVPEVGYKWTRHRGQMCETHAPSNEQYLELRKAMLKLLTKNGPIGHYGYANH